MAEDDDPAEGTPSSPSAVSDATAFPVDRRRRRKRQRRKGTAAALPEEHQQQRQQKQVQLPSQPFGRHYAEMRAQGLAGGDEWATPGGAEAPGWGEARNNPHCYQVLWNPCSLGYSERSDVPFTRVLSDAVPELPYRRRTGEEKTSLHWGQRKLLMSEIEFLTLHGSRSATVVYAGAAPGTHVKYLSDLFPEHKWVLVDPAPFTVRDSDRIETRQGFFTDDMARSFNGMGVLFISDIRSADWMEIPDSEVEEAVARDMTMQQTWCDLMCPAASMLKFRLPWGSGTTEYLAGDVFLPVWGPLTTTEGRLISTSLEKRMWDNLKYESQMFYFNTVMRPAMYQHAVAGEGIDHCYDCRAEIHIVEQYLRTFTGESPVPMAQRVSELSMQISRQLSTTRKLSSPNSDPAERKKAITKRQYIDGKPAWLSCQVHMQPTK